MSVTNYKHKLLNKKKLVFFLKMSDPKLGRGRGEYEIFFNCYHAISFMTIAKTILYASPLKVIWAYWELKLKVITIERVESGNRN